MSELLDTFRSFTQAGFSEENAMTNAEALQRVKNFEQEQKDNVNRMQKLETGIVVLKIIGLVIVGLLIKIAFFQ